MPSILLNDKSYYFINFALLKNLYKYLSYKILPSQMKIYRFVCLKPSVSLIRGVLLVIWI